MADHRVTLPSRGTLPGHRKGLVETSRTSKTSKVPPLGRNNPGHQDKPKAHPRGLLPPLPSRDSVIVCLAEGSSSTEHGGVGQEHGRQ